MRSTILKITVPTLVLLLIFISYTNLERFEPTADTFTDSEKIVEIAVRANSMEQSWPACGHQYGKPGGEAQH